MSNPEKTYKKAKVSGHVSYLNEMNQRVSVPRGPCEISDNNGYGPIYLRWIISDVERETELTLIEFSRYSNTKDLVVLP
jgi:hypothetical protein